MNNIMELIQLINGSNNPRQLLINMLQQRNNNNPMVSNVIGMINNNNMAGIETLARNMCKEKGIDADKLAGNLKQYMR